MISKLRLNTLKSGVRLLSTKAQAADKVKDIPNLSDFMKAQSEEADLADSEPVFTYGDL